MGMNIATKAALTALSGVKIGGGYAVEGVGKGIGYVGFGLKWTGEKIEQGGDAMAKFGGEMVDSGFLAWKIASGALSDEELQNIVNEAEKKEAVNAETVEDAEATMEAVAEVIKTAEEKTTKTDTATAQKSETEMSPAEMAEAFC